MRKRIFATLLSILLIFSFIPTTNVFATDYIDTNVTVTDHIYYLSNDMEIKEGATLTFESLSSYEFHLNSYTLTNYGTIDGSSVYLICNIGAFYNYGVYEFGGINGNEAGDHIYDLTLSSIALSSGTLSPSFKAGTREYAVTVDNSVTSINITPTLNTGTGVDSMAVNRVVATSGAATTVSLRVGENTIPIVINAGGATNTYTLTVTRENNEDYIISNASFATTFGYYLQWSDVSAPGGYKLEIYTESGTQVYSGTLENNYTPVSEVLTASGTYYFTVYALDESGDELSYKTSSTFTYTHTHSLTYVGAQDATCTENGNKEYWYCSGCGKYFNDSDATTEINPVIEAKGHSWDEGTVTTKATCTEEGVKTYTCTVCDETKTEKIEATGHSYEA
ncbi:MAG: cadherin-like beta sandwich domain-containing protein, partial [Lachnospiraceae bacterium]|nr:cadherin-like beta sandwich domain-containing protein [Lachnospiraceae bacterium]